ncbi:MAG: hypothetical protein ACOC1X_01225 [Promethearchaeota archaeon]
MPKPPKPNEDKNTFISRCISELEELGEGEDRTERLGMCYGMWENNKESED